MPKVIGIIPSRFASRRFPGKPLALLGELPLIVRVYQQAQKSTFLDDVIVATDDQRIADVVKKHDGKSVLTDKKFICGSDRVASVAKNIKADIILNIQGDQPFISPEVIDKVVNCLIDNPQSVQSTACSPFGDLSEVDNPNVVKVVMAKNGRALYFSRNRIPWFDKNDQANPESIKVYKHIGIYGFTPEYLQIYASLAPMPLEQTENLEQLRTLENGYDIYCIKTAQPFISIDSQQDLLKAEKILESLR